MGSHFENLIRPYAGWIALLLLAIAIFSALIATNVIFPVLLLVAAGISAGVRFLPDFKPPDIWAIDEWLRTRSSALGIREWHAPYQAADVFCNPTVVRARNEAAGEMNSIMMELVKRPDRRERIPDDSHPTIPESTKAPGSAHTHTQFDAAQTRFNRCNNALSRELLALLSQGDLIGKGLLMQNDVALSERIIPPSRWRIMNLDISKSTASGHGWNYVGLVIGKRRSVAAIKKAPGTSRRH